MPLDSEKGCSKSEYNLLVTQAQITTGSIVYVYTIGLIPRNDIQNRPQKLQNCVFDS